MHDHPHIHPVRPAPSLLRLSAAQRLLGAGGLIALVWLVVFWALQ